MPPEHDPTPGLIVPPSDRPFRASGARADHEELRHAYLELLKLGLCDLLGTTTSSVGKHEKGLVMSRDLAGEERKLRSVGMDWPRYGLTMAGLHRLDDLQDCVENIVRDGVEGELIETGVWRGGSSILMRATLDSLGEYGRTVWAADSFRGFPARDDQEDLNQVAFLSVSLDEVKANFARFGYEQGVKFLPGYFENSMAEVGQGPWSIVRLDGDTYDATWVTLDALYPNLAVGGYLIVDDYGVLEECAKAVDDYRVHQGIDEPIEKVDWTCVRWRRTSDAPLSRVERESPEAPAEPPPDAEDLAAQMPRVPSSREIELQGENEDLRASLATVEAELRRFKASPVRKPQELLRRVRGR